jgi:hypothetical protein
MIALTPEQHAAVERAARWCKAAGIPEPDEVGPGLNDDPIIAVWWQGGEEHEARFYADGEIRWDSYWGNCGHDSASLIAAINEAMNI